MTDLTFGGPDTGDPESPDHAGLIAERERLARTLRDTRLQLAMTQARLTALEGSSTMRFGKTLVNAAKRPWPRGATLPRDLVRLWRERSGGKEGAELAVKLAAAQLADLAGAGERFLSALTPPGRPDVTSKGLVITGALTARGAATLAPDAVVHPLLPHDADVLLESTGADLVIIEAAALLAGAPWAFAADPSATDRGRRLARMIVMARSLGKPVVFIRNVPAHLRPSMQWLAGSCDIVRDDGLGVQLARFNPIGLDPARNTRPVYAGQRDPRESPSLRAMLDAVTGDLVTAAEPPSWRGLPDFYRSHALFVAAGAHTALEQAACGARVVTVADRASGGGDRLREQIEAAAALPPLTISQARQGLRDIFLDDAVAAQLSAIVAHAGLPPGIVGGRQIAVLAEAGWDAGDLAATVLRQRLLPEAVIVATDDPQSATAALAPLADRGITVRPVPAVSSIRPGSAATATALATYAPVPWVAPFQPRTRAYPDTYLLDLACAREAAQADAVGFGDTDYAYAAEITPALARRDLLGRPDAPEPSVWGSHGYRLFTITEIEE
jgi:hypothetical protein